MKIRLDAARFEPFSWQESVELSEEEQREIDLVEVGPIRISGTLSSATPDFLLHAELRFEPTVACNRCLKPVRQEMASTIDLVLVERSHRQEPTADEALEAEELGLVEVEGGVVDTRPLVVEQVELSLPMKPLCREDCAGLCSHCGQDLNEGGCDCQREVIDPRWAALAKLKETKNDGSASRH